MSDLEFSKQTELSRLFETDEYNSVHRLIITHCIKAMENPNRVNKKKIAGYLNSFYSFNLEDGQLADVIEALTDINSFKI